MANEQTGGGFGWDDTVDVPESGFTILPDGPCYFTIDKMERQRKEFGKFGMSNVAVLKFTVSPVDGEERVELDVQFPLVTQMGWKTVQLATACGLRQHGESSTVNSKWWAQFVGQSGKCMVGHRSYKSKKDGSDRVSNDITAFLDPAAEPEAPSFD